MTIIEHLQLPGRLGDPAMVLRTDPRADPRLVAALAAFGLDGAPEAVPVNKDSPIEAIIEFTMAAEPGFATLFDAMLASLPPVEGVRSSSEVITGVAGPGDDSGCVPAAGAFPFAACFASSAFFSASRRRLMA